MAKNLDLISYLPPFLQEYRELSQILSSAQVSLHSTNLSIDWLLDTQFISSCDELGIAFYENLLSIYPASSDSLSARIERVLLKWLDFPPYTVPYIISILDNLYGCDNYEFTEDFNNYSFSINFINNFLPADLDSFYQYIYYIKPANLIFNTSAYSSYSSDIFVGVAFTSSYVKSTFTIDGFSPTVSIFSNLTHSSHYVKEVFFFE